MKKKKKRSKRDSNSIPGIDVAFLQAIGKIRALDDRLRRLISYVEYLADSLDKSIDYSRFLAQRRRDENQIPSFEKFSMNLGSRKTEEKRIGKL